MDFTTKRKLFKACRDGDLETVSKILTPGNVNITWGLEESEAKEQGLEDDEIVIDPPGCVVYIEYSASTTLLHVAAAAGAVEVTELLLKKGGHLEARDGKERTPLRLASMAGAVGVVKLLISYKADICAKDIFGKTPLHSTAYYKGGTEVAEILIEKGCDVDAKDEEGDTPLHEACYHGNAKVAQLLINRGANIYEQDKKGRTPLHLAGYSKDGGTEVAELLLEKGCNVSGRDADGRTPLHVASQEGNAEVARLLISRGADFGEKDDVGVTPLHLAGCSKDGGCEVAVILLEKGSEVSVKDKFGNTPLQGACKFGNAKVVQLLLSHGADIHAKRNDGGTPLHWAGISKDGGSEVAKILLDKGSEVNLKDKEGRTPLHFASEFGNAKVAQLLLSRGADIHAKRNDGATPLHWAGCKKDGGSEVAEILLEEGSEVNVKDEVGDTPLHDACYRGNAKVAQLLINHGANIHEKSNDGATPLHKAGLSKEASGETEMANGAELVDLFVKHGGDTNITDRSGQTPLHYAAKEGIINVYQTLLRYGADPTIKDDKSKTAPSCAVSKHIADLNEIHNHNRESKHKFIVMNWDYLKSEVHLDIVLESLVENGVLKRHRMEAIQRKPLDERHSQLLNELKEADSDPWYGLLTCLDETIQGHIALRLRWTEQFFANNPNATAAELNQYLAGCAPPVDLLLFPTSRAICWQAGVSLRNTRSKVEVLGVSLGLLKMKKIHQDCLRMNIVYMQHELQMEQLCYDLLQNSVLKESQIQSILNKEQGEQIFLLFKFLKNVGPQVWKSFLVSLINTNHAPVAWRLRTTEYLCKRSPDIKAAEVTKYFKDHPAPSYLMPGIAGRPNLPPQPEMNIKHTRESFEKLSLQAPLKTRADDGTACRSTEQMVSSAGGETLRERYIRAREELSDRTCTSDRLRTLLSRMNTLPDGSPPDRNTLSFMEDVHWSRVWENLWRIKNAKCMPTLMDILRILMADKSFAKHAWASMMKISGDHIITLSVMEILCLCAEIGAKPTDGELQKLLERTDAMTRDEELTVVFLKTLVELCSNKHFTCDLQCLGDFYVVSQEMLNLGKQLVHAVHGTMDSCLRSKKLIDILLFISNKHQETNILIEDLSCENWLKRSPLHLAAIILDSRKAWKCLPRNMFKNNLNKKDLHGCTPLHLAYLHHNKQAIEFLTSHGAMLDVCDTFGIRPKSLDRTPKNHPDVKYQELCRSVLETKNGMLKKMGPLLVHSEIAAKSLSDEVKTLFECLVRGTQFGNARIFIAGSMREKLKAGRLDEVDVILEFEEDVFNKRKLFVCLRKRLAEISWEGIGLRPISIHGPWKFLREGMTVSLDVVVVFVDKLENRDGHRLQEELLWGNRTLYKRMVYFTLEMWNFQGDLSFKPTYFAYEWDMIDSLPTNCRLTIVIAKALLQAYDLCKNDSLRVKLPVTSYMIKTALFYILAYQSGQLDLNDLDLKNALAHVEGNVYRFTRPNRLMYNPEPKWLTDADVGQHGEEARVLGRKIFNLIKRLAQLGRKLNSYWDRRFPVVPLEDYGEAECIGDVCDCALERLNSNTFY